MLIILLLTMSNIFLDITHYLIHLAINNVEFLVNVILQTRKRWVKAIFKICKILFHATKTCVMRICGSKGHLKNEFQISISRNLNFCSFFYKIFSVPQHSSDLLHHLTYPEKNESVYLFSVSLKLEIFVLIEPQILNLIFKFLLLFSKKILKALCCKGEVWLFRDAKRLECFKGIEVHSVTVYAENKSKCIVELIFIIHQKLEKKEML